MKESEEKSTNKKVLVKGLKRLLLALPVLVLTTYLFTFTFLNKDTLPIYLILPLALIGMGVTIYLLFNGIKLVLKSLFD